MKATELAYGRDRATTHGMFVGAYAIVTVNGIKTITGDSPDGRRDQFMCTRCGRDISNVYVFTDEKRSFMHVGIDCAANMGVSTEELRRARNYWRERASAAQREEARANAAERKAAQEAMERLNHLACAEIVDEIRALASHPAATSFEKSAIDKILGKIGRDKFDWFDPMWQHKVNSGRDIIPWDSLNSATLESIRDRIALCATSTADTRKAITGTLRAYRKPVSFDSEHGTTYVSFLTDDAGRAYVYKGGRPVHHGETVIGTWSVGETDTRDGLTATKLSRPRKTEYWGCSYTPVCR